MRSSHTATESPVSVRHSSKALHDSPYRGHHAPSRFPSVHHSRVLFHVRAAALPLIIFSRLRRNAWRAEAASDTHAQPDETSVPEPHASTAVSGYGDDVPWWLHVVALLSHRVDVTCDADGSCGANTHTHERANAKPSARGNLQGVRCCLCKGEQDCDVSTLKCHFDGHSRGRAATTSSLVFKRMDSRAFWHMYTRPRLRCEKQKVGLRLDQVEWEGDAESGDRGCIPLPWSISDDNLQQQKKTTSCRPRSRV